MSQSIFPTLITQIFIPSLWRFPSSQITADYLNANFLKFPRAQGSETFPANISVSGTTNLGLTNINNQDLNILDSTGAIANTMNSNGFTTRNSVAAATQFILYTSISGSGVSQLRKNFGLSVNSSTNVITAGGLILGTSGITSTGLITANGGLTMGGANNITLGSGATAPTSGQLGFTTRNINYSPSLTPLTTSYASYYTLTLPSPGTYLITNNLLLDYGGAGNTTSGDVQYFWGTTSGSVSGLILGTNTITFLPLSTSAKSLSAPNQSFVYTTPSSVVNIYLNAVYSSQVVAPKISQGNNYISYTRIA